MRVQFAPLFKPELLGGGIKCVFVLFLANCPLRVDNSYATHTNKIINTLTIKRSDNIAGLQSMITYTAEYVHKFHYKRHIIATHTLY